MTEARPFFPIDSLKVRPGLEPKTTPPQAETMPGISIAKKEKDYKGKTPVVFFSITDLCNSKCTTCDYWQNTKDGGFLTQKTILDTVDSLAAYDPKTIYFTGGEPLLRAKDLFAVTTELREKEPDIQLRLYTNGLSIGKYEKEIIENFDIINVSIDSFTDEGYDKIRGVNGLPTIKRNIKSLKEKSPETVVRVNTVLQKGNFRELPDMVAQTEEIGANFITFLPLDFKSESFSRKDKPDLEPQIIGLDELDEFREIVGSLTNDEYLRAHPVLREQGKDLKRVLKYYEEVNGVIPTENPECDVADTTAIVTSSGEVQLCFFTPPVGSLRTNTMDEVLSSPKATELRQQVADRERPECRNCICPLTYKDSTVGIVRHEVYSEKK